MLLDLFITHWTEPWEIGKKGFDILALQRDIDWNDIRVTLVHDGTDAFPEEYFAGYPFAVNQVSIPHSGIAGARNWCIEHSEAEWIKWNDFDDMFANVYSLRSIIDALENGRSYDLLWFDIYAEYENKRWLKDERDPVVLHGKIFRRSFLIAKDLRFNEELTWCEDSAFLALVEMEIDVKRIGRIRSESVIYTWIYRDGSLCNRPEIKFENLKSFFKRHKYVQQEFLKHGAIDQYNTMSVRIMADAYYTLELAGIKEDMSEHRKDVIQYYMEHRADILKVSDKWFNMALNAVNRENENCHITKSEFVAWLKSLRQEVI